MNKGKKLNKQDLKIINGGRGNIRCTNSSGTCRIYGPGCLEKKCQPQEPLEPIEIVTL